MQIFFNARDIGARSSKKLLIEIFYIKFDSMRNK